LGRDELPQGVGATRPAAHRLDPERLQPRQPFLRDRSLGDHLSRAGALPPNSRKTLFDRLGRYETANGPKAIATYVALARRHGLDPAQMAISFAVSRPFVTSAIIGATTLAQLKTDSAALDLTLDDQVLADIEQIHLDYPNPCP
jgi:aryl-alcohol dehydrogenase-like predicted oxidoreductase